MRDLKINCRPVYYSRLQEGTETDKFGNSVKAWTEPVKMMLSYAPRGGKNSSGGGEPDIFGEHIHYDYEGETHNMNCPIDEYTKMWIDCEPLETEANARCVKRVKSINIIRFAIKIDNVKENL